MSTKLSSCNRLVHGFLSGSLCLAAWLAAGNLAAQEIDATHWVTRTFYGPDELELVVGQFTGLIEGHARIVDVNGQTHRYAMAAIHPDDWRWIVEQVNRQRKRTDSRREFARLAPQLIVNRPASVINACRRIRNLDREAGLEQNGLIELLNRATDEQVRYEALLAYVAIMPATDEKLDNVLSALTNHWKAITPALERRPEEFLVEIAKLGSVGEPYLLHVVYGGYVTPPSPGSVLLEEMQTLADDDMQSWRAREAGIKALARLRTEDAARVILQVLQEAEKIEAERLNEQMIRTCLIELGHAGIDNTDVQFALSNHAGRFPQIVETSRRLIAAAQPSTDK